MIVPPLGGVLDKSNSLSTVTSDRTTRISVAVHSGEREDGNGVVLQLFPIGEEYCGSMSQ